MVHTPSPPTVALLGDEGRSGFVLFAGMFSGIPRWRLRLPSIVPLDCDALQWSLLRLLSLVLFLLLKSFALPVFYQVHQEQSAAGEMTKNTVVSPVVQEQVIVQAIPIVVGSLPPGEVVAAPVYHYVHHDQFAAGEDYGEISGIPCCAGTGDRSCNSSCR